MSALQGPDSRSAVNDGKVCGTRYMSAIIGIRSVEDKRCVDVGEFS